MNCETCVLLLDEYLNNELEDNLYCSVSAHLGNCENCRAEIQFLNTESNFYQKVALVHEKNFKEEWQRMRNRLEAESLIKNDIFFEQNTVTGVPPIHIFTAFFIRLEKLFINFKIAFGVLILVVLGIGGIFLVTYRNISNDGKFTTAIEKVALPKDQVVINLPENPGLQQKKGKDSNKINVIKKPDYNRKIIQPPLIVAITKNYLVSSKKNEKLKAVGKSANTVANSYSSDTAARLPVEKTDSDFQTAAADKKLAEYLNKVHLFLLMVCNLENDETIKAVIGDKFQTEAQVFLKSNNILKTESLRNKNIPVVELLNRIEPVLRAMTDLGNQNYKTGFTNMTAMVKQTGIIFKMRLWMSNAKLEKEKSL